MLCFFMPKEIYVIMLFMLYYYVIDIINAKIIFFGDLCYYIINAKFISSFFVALSKRRNLIYFRVCFIFNAN